MRRILRDHITFQTNRLHGCSGENLLTKQALSRFSDALYQLAETVAHSTLTGYISDEVLPENPFATVAPDLITNDQRENALNTIQKKLQSGALTLPSPLVEIMNRRLTNVTDAFMEMLGRLKEHRESICKTLLDGRTFTKIEDITLCAGDTHNNGRSVTILVTDAGKFVYKPHDSRGDAGIYAFVSRFFSDTLGIPRCYAVDDQFGVCEFIEKHRSEGAENAEAFWKNMGGASAIIKMLGSTDMHIENITCRDNKPYILDLENIISPEIANHTYQKLHPELWVMKSRSPYLSGLFPSQRSGRQLSVLLNTDEEGCAPAVDGNNISVTSYLREFLCGYDTIYHRIMENKEAIKQMLCVFVSEMPVRVLIRNTQSYHDTIIKLYHRNALSSVEKRDATSTLLEKIMRSNIRSEFKQAVDSELRQLKCGDIPYIYTYGSSNKLWSEGDHVTDEVFETTAEQHILQNIAVMSETDEQLDLALLERCILQFPRQLTQEKDPVLPVRTKDVITKEQALAEAGKLFEKVKDLCIESHDGILLWGIVSEPDNSFRFCEAGLTNGLIGIAVFAAAYAKASGSDTARTLADTIMNETVTMLNRMYDYLEEMKFLWEHAPNLGESEGIGGIITGLALLVRYTGRHDIRALQEKTLFTLEQLDLSKYGAPDRMVGMAGLLSALCRFEQYRTHTDLIKKAADSLFTMKTLEYKGNTLWKSFSDKKRPISGGGHGLAGIAEALYAASAVLHEGSYAEVAADAIAFERETYNEKYGTWSDLRTYPPVGYMHGYCSGAPGIGIMLERICGNGFTSDELKKCAELAAESITSLPLNERDHLCCGNSAIAEYYLTTGDHDAAGQILNAMLMNCQKTGSYRYMGHKYNNSETASLFYGVSGVGYEMLRYAFPDQILSVI